MDILHNKERLLSLVRKNLHLTSEGLILVGHLFYNQIKDLDVDTIGGPATGAIPYTCATALISKMNGNSLNTFYIRKEIKRERHILIEGILDKGMNVVIVDDVLATGKSLSKVINKVENVGAKIVKIITLLDKNMGGRDILDKQRYDYTSIFNYNKKN